ncbi:MAG: M20/M25/M40 family metallo-hydrolase [Planctomycetales bacterium]|nr:M20/M25/M40 family metallo-hydrolase [Planctomycetales bacterium]
MALTREPDDDPVALLRELVGLRSVSGEEAGVRDRLAAWIRERGGAPTIEGRNLLWALGDGPRRLLLTSHTDTVPVAPGWTGDPFGPGTDPGRVLGLGSSDAKASVVAMAAACVRLAREGLPPGASLLLAAVCDEEVGGEGMPILAPGLPPCAGAVVGEPTGFAVCPAQRGLVRIEAVARGRAGHASRPHEGMNAIEIATDDLARIRALPLPPPHPLVGAATICVTEIRGGTARNVIPAECRFTLDIRTTPALDNARAVSGIRAACRSELAVVKDRIRPVETPADAAIVLAARAALPASPVRGFGGVSDLAFLGGIPGIVLGPGDPARSHRPDEWIEAEAVRRAVEVLVTVAREFFQVPGGAGGEATRHAQ